MDVEQSEESEVPITNQRSLRTNSRNKKNQQSQVGRQQNVKKTKLTTNQTRSTNTNLVKQQNTKNKSCAGSSLSESIESNALFREIDITI